MNYKPTTSSAIEFAQNNSLEEWVHLFLCNEGNNQSFSDGLRLEPRKYLAPKLMNLDQFERCCGPEDGMKFQIPFAGFDTNVNAIINKYKSGDWDMPPLIINCTNGIYELNDGNHRLEALQRLKIKEFWVIIWETVNE